MEELNVRTPLVCQGTRTDVASMVRLSREVQGLTQHQLAARMDSTQSTVARWESGEHEITMGTLTRIADALGVVFNVSFGSSENAK
ncbi:helix-turn-helix domain-containing protein [Arthrobacter crystallopoietes]|uniref:Helix-turn-helix n=1 Tax=Crystallibacter crystallopoietes TaxID=37928 RepID=A0A1H0XLA3_9MICC|nr:helix-turn-helix transcriptional regulator [Arthrobacter crystallopoietes]SDQ03704.1 Helix-turn-helix [Arthrobacter crystallopoietes]